MLKISALLDEFKHKYGRNVSIEKGYLDITECFFSKTLNKYKSPKSFGNLSLKNRVFLYVVYGAPFIEKYKKDKNGALFYHNGKFIPVDISEDYIVLACLCLREIKNVSLHEIYDSIYPNKKVDVQGFRRWVLREIISLVKKEYPRFDVEKDTAFIFAGKEKEVSAKIELVKIWLSQFLMYGSGSLNMLSEREKKLINIVFGDKRKNYADSIYKFREVTLEETGEFLKAKLDLTYNIPAK